MPLYNAHANPSQNNQSSYDYVPGYLTHFSIPVIQTSVYQLYLSTLSSITQFDPAIPMPMLLTEYLRSDITLSQLSDITGCNCVTLSTAALEEFAFEYNQYLEEHDRTSAYAYFQRNHLDAESGRTFLLPQALEILRAGGRLSFPIPNSTSNLFP
jgi:hypothetical protein